MRTRYRFLLSNSILTMGYLLSTAHPSLGQRSKTQPNPQPKVIAGDPAAKTPDSTGTFSEVLRKLLANAPDGFLSLRKTKRPDSMPSAETWDTGVRFPGAFSNCWVIVVSSFSDVSCFLQDESQESMFV